MRKNRLYAWLLLLGIGAGIPAAAQTDTIVNKTPQNRAVLLEEYTGVKCSNCPDGHRISNNLAEKYPDRFYAVNIHASSFAEPYGFGEPDFRTTYGDALMQAAGATTLPSAVINRHLFQANGLALDRLHWEGYAESCLEMPAYANIAGKATFDWQTRELNVEVQVFFTGSVPVETNRIYVVLLQNNIIGTQKNASNNPAQNLGNNLYRHMHVFRDFITDERGVELHGGTEGDFVRCTYSKRLPERIRNIELRPDDLSVIVFVSEDYNEVINVAEAPIQMKNGPGHLFAYRNGFQSSHRSCDNDIRVGFTLENRTYGGEPIHEIGFRVNTVNEAEAAAFTVNVPDRLGYKDNIDILSDLFPLPRRNQVDTVTVSIASVNGKSYDFDQQKTLRIPVAKQVVYTAEPVVEVHLWQDMFGSETQWMLWNEAGEVLVAEGPYEDLTKIGVKEHIKAVTLHEGCHTFKITDAKGDGINNLFGKGHFSLNTPNGTVLTENDGQFGDSALVFIRKGAVVNEQHTADIHITLFPNPVKDCLHITSVHEIREVRIFNPSGKQERCIPAGGTMDFSCSVNDLKQGFHMAEVVTTAGTALLKFIVR